MEETRKSSKTVKVIIIAVVVAILVAGICFLSQWKDLTWTGDYCKMCATREKTQGSYCDICYEKVQNAFATTP